MKLFIVEIFKDRKWNQTAWTNKIAGAPRDHGAGHPPFPLPEEGAKTALKIAQEKFPENEYRIAEVKKEPSVLKVLEERYAEINARVQDPSNYYVCSVFNAERRGALEMLEAYKEAIKTDEEKPQVVTVGGLVQFLCTGETKAQELLERFQTLFPSAVSFEKRSADAERDHRPATLGTAARRA